MQAGAVCPSGGVLPAGTHYFVVFPDSLDTGEFGNGGISMKSLALKMRRFLVSEDGPTAVEYAVMLALIIIVCLAAITTIGTQASTSFNRVGASLQTANTGGGT
jgi:pilus assembly protein Flp/PilA